MCEREGEETRSQRHDDNGGVHLTRGLHEMSSVLFGWPRARATTAPERQSCTMIVWFASSPTDAMSLPSPPRSLDGEKQQCDTPP